MKMMKKTLASSRLMYRCDFGCKWFIYRKFIDEGRTACRTVKYARNLKINTAEPLMHYRWKTMSILQK